jgi:stearoyl-CoA desaturase (delta-9 desaturase)
VNAAWAAPFVVIALTQVAVLATSMYLRYALAYRSLHLHPLADIAFRTVLWLTTGQCRQELMAVRRKHHTCTDRDGDAHGPRLLGFWRVQLFNVAYYMREARNPETLDTFAPDLRPDRVDRALVPHGVLGLVVGLGLLAIQGPPIAWARAPTCSRVPWHRRH